MMNEWILSSSILIAAVLAVRFLLRGKISLRLQYALWAVVLLRLLVPFQIFNAGFGTGAIANAVDLAEPVRQVYFSANEDRYEREYEEAIRQIASQSLGTSDAAEPMELEREAANQARNVLELDLNQALFGIWLAGMAVMAAVIIACNVHLARQLRRRRWAMEVADCLLPVYVTEAVPTPCIFGFFRPVIYLTPDAAGDETVMGHVLAHELTHYRHLDHVWSVLRSLCLVFHWYNPLVWVAAKVSRADAELACDEGALERLGEEARGDYGRTLIGLTCAAPISDLFRTATTMTGSAGSIRERIKLLMKRPRTTALTLTAVILLVTLIVGCTFTGAPETREPNEHTPQIHTPQTETTEPVSGEPITAYLADETVQTDYIYRTKESEYMSVIVFNATEELLNVQLGQLQGTEESGYRMDMQFSIPALEAGQTLAAHVTFWGSSTVYGIRFTDSNGNDRHFSVTLSGMDGSLILNEYIPEENLTKTEIACALPMEQAMEQYADQDPRELTETELEQFRAAFRTMDDAGNGNPAACFLLPFYEDISEMSGREFLAYFPTDQAGTEEEFDLLKEKYPDAFEGWTWENMPIPIHRYDPADIDAVLSRFSDVRWAYLNEGVHYLEETGCYYNYTSDAGLGGFYARSGFVYDGGAVVYSDYSALFLTDTRGGYVIQAHLPAIIHKPLAGEEPGV